MNVKYNVVIQKEEEWYVAKCLDNSVASQGKTIEEALNNLKEETEKYILGIRRENNMTRLKTLKNSYSKLKESFSRIITGKEVWSRHMDRLIEEAEESLKTEGYITLEELREELIREYNVKI